jgi:hypothetical protein
VYSRLPSFVLGFHGCDRVVGEAILSGKIDLNPSQNDYDWLGSGAYFWENNPERALDFARMLAGMKRRSVSNIREPFVLGAVLDLGHCLNLLDHRALVVLREQYDELAKFFHEAGLELPTNSPLRSGEDLILRRLDRAVIESLHLRREKLSLPPYDSVRGVFLEGPELYPNAGFRAKNHIQICIRNPRCVLGYFRPRGHLLPDS